MMSTRKPVFNAPPRAEPSGRLTFSESMRLIRQPHVMLCALYAIAICFEQLVDIEVFKPYRLIGGALVVLMLVKGQYLFDRFGRLATAFVGTGFAIALMQTAFGAGEFAALFSTMARWCFNIVTYVAIASLLKSRRELTLVAVIHALVLLVAAYGISLDASREEIYGEARMGRASGDFGNPANACVTMLFSTLVLITGLRRRFAGPPWRALSILAMIAICGYFLYTATLTGSRAGAALLMVGLAVYFVLTWPRRVVATVPVFVLVGALAISLSTVDLDFSERNVLAARVEKKGLDMSRLYLWRAGLDAYADTLGLGVGMSRYQHLHKDYFAPYAYRSDPRWLNRDLTLHNDYVIALVEFGTIGFFIFILLCAELWRMVKQVSDPTFRAIAIAVVIGMAINGLSHAGFPYFVGWFYFALLSAWLSMERIVGPRRVRPDWQMQPLPARPQPMRIGHK